MDTGRLVVILEQVRSKLVGLDGRGSTGAANQAKAAQKNKASTAHAKAKLKELDSKRTASRSTATKIDAKGARR